MAVQRADPDAGVAGDRLQRHRPPVGGGECRGRHLEQLLPIAARVGPNTLSQSGGSSVSATVEQTEGPPHFYQCLTIEEHHDRQATPRRHRQHRHPPGRPRRLRRHATVRDVARRRGRRAAPRGRTRRQPHRHRIVLRPRRGEPPDPRGAGALPRRPRHRQQGGRALHRRRADTPGPGATARRAARRRRRRPEPTGHRPDTGGEPAADGPRARACRPKATRSSTSTTSWPR